MSGKEIFYLLVCIYFICLIYLSFNNLIVSNFFIETYGRTMQMNCICKNIMLPASRGTEELMPYLQEYCLGYLRVKSSSGMVALAHISHMPCSWTKSSLYFLCDYVFRECFQAGAIVLNMYCELSCEGCFSHLSYLAFLFREYLRSLLSLI